MCMRADAIYAIIFCWLNDRMTSTYYRADGVMIIINPFLHLHFKLQRSVRVTVTRSKNFPPAKERMEIMKEVLVRDLQPNGCPRR